MYIYFFLELFQMRFKVGLIKMETLSVASFLKGLKKMADITVMQTNHWYKEHHRLNRPTFILQLYCVPENILMPCVLFYRKTSLQR